MSEILITNSQNIIKELDSSNLDEFVRISQNVKFNYFVYAKNSEININLQTMWDNVSWNIFILCYGPWECKWDIITRIGHPNADINVLILTLLQDDNSMSINWDITLSKWVSDSQWHLLEKNLIIWKNIKVKATPRLDVYSSNIHATHWVSVDKIDPESLYYMESRGLSFQRSQNLLISWYIQNIFANFTEISDQESLGIQNKILSSIAITND